MRLSSRVGEDLVGRALLDQLAEVEEGGALRDARRLLHRVGDDDDACSSARSSSISSSILRGGDRVERRARLVHQDHFRADGDGARDAQALLLAAGEAGARLVQAVLDLVPQAGALLQARRTISSSSALSLARPWMRGP